MSYSPYGTYDADMYEPVVLYNTAGCILVTSHTCVSFHMLGVVPVATNVPKDCTSGAPTLEKSSAPWLYGTRLNRYVLPIISSVSGSIVGVFNRHCPVDTTATLRGCVVGAVVAILVFLSICSNRLTAHLSYTDTEPSPLQSLVVGTTCTSVGTSLYVTIVAPFTGVISSLLAYTLTPWHVRSAHPLRPGPPSIRYVTAYLLIRSSLVNSPLCRPVKLQKYSLDKKCSTNSHERLPLKHRLPWLVANQCRTKLY